MIWKLVREDWNLYQRNPLNRGLWVMLVYRFGCWRYTIPWRAVRMPFSFAYKISFLICQILTGVELPCETVVGRRLRIEHTSDIVISGDSRLGDDVILRNGVTIGLRRTGVRGAPRIGNRVDIGAGAKILGEISIGDDACIGANAVVLQDVPAGCIAIGVPAQIRIRRKSTTLAQCDASRPEAGNCDDLNGSALALQGRDLNRH